MQLNYTQSNYIQLNYVQSNYVQSNNIQLNYIQLNYIQSNCIQSNYISHISRQFDFSSFSLHNKFPELQKWVNFLDEIVSTLPINLLELKGQVSLSWFFGEETALLKRFLLK